MLSNPSLAFAAAPVGLGAAGTYSVLAGTMVTSTDATTLSGDLGVSPGTDVVGFPPGIVNGAIRTGDQAAQAQADLLAAYNNAASRTPTASFAGDNNGRTFTPGVHHTATAFALTGTMTLDGQGDPNAVFIFQVDAALNTAADSQISLINGAKAPHIFWQVVGAAGTGASSSFSGTIMAAGAITIGAGGTLAGRALSRDTVTLAGNAVTTISDPVVTITGGAAASTNDATPTITGTTDAATSTTVTVTVAGQTLTTTVQPGGTWAITAATLTDGAHTVMASITNLAGFTGAAAQTLTVDTSVPVVTITGGAASATNTATPTIAGTVDAVAGTTVTVSVAGQTLTTPVQSGGTWAVTTATLVNGTHSVLVSVTDMAGNTGTAAQALTVDTTIALVGLGAAGTYSVLAGTMVTSVGVSVVSGDLGVSPGTAVVGFPPGMVNGSIRTGGQAAQAQADLLVAYNNAGARVPTASFAGDNNGRTFTPGVHHTSAAFALTGTMTLDGQGDPNAVFIFQVGAALNTAATSRINLINGAKSQHVFWQVLGAAGTGASSSFSGTIMAAGAITVGAGGSLAGRALSRDTVTLAGNTVTTISDPVVTITGGAEASTNDATPTITGSTDAASSTTVTVTVAGQTLTTAVQSGGVWAVTAAMLTAGPHTVTASVTDPAGNTGTATQTLTLVGGSLSITVPTDAGNLGSGPPTAGGGTISGALGQVQVSDTRHAGAGSGWVASVASTDFATPTGRVIPAKGVGYTAGPITKVGTATYAANDPGDLSGVVRAVTATEITGDNSATWNPVINVAIPDSAIAGVYSATITHSVL
ncbi:ice-binding family protein [Arthrobacter sp. MDT3-24]